MNVNRLRQWMVVTTVPVILGYLVVGCEMERGPTGRSVGEAWEEPHAAPSVTQGGTLDVSGKESSTAQPEPPMPIATVNGRPIARAQMMDMLLRSHGLGVMEQLIALELARETAEAEGVSIMPADIQAEYDRAVAMISSPVPAATQPVLGKEVRETLLTQILARRGLSRDEFRLAMERQAYLRKVALKKLKITDQMLRAQYEMMYDARVQVRHIQLLDWRDVAKVQKLLASGSDFAEVARVHSQNPQTASEGGLLPPFSRNQDDVPPILREVAFSLQIGQVSNPIRIDSDYHLVKPVQRFEKSQVQFEHVKEIVRSKLIDRLLPETTAKIERELFTKAQITIADAKLRQQFDEKYSKVRAARSEK